MRTSLFFLLGLTVIALPALALAQGFNFLAPLEAVRGSDNLPQYLSAIFKIGIAVAAFLAIIMIAIGGFEYMGSDLISSKEKGKQRITSAILGLLLILFSVALLYTINPDILNLKIGGQDLAPVQTQSSTEASGGSKTTQILAPSQAQGRQRLIEFSGGCSAAEGKFGSDLTSYTCSKSVVTATEPSPGNLQQNNAAFRQFSSTQCAGGVASVESGTFVCRKDVVFDRQPKN